MEEPADATKWSSVLLGLAGCSLVNEDCEGKPKGYTFKGHPLSTLRCSSDCSHKGLCYTGSMECNGDGKAECQCAPKQGRSCPDVTNNATGISITTTT